MASSTSTRAKESRDAKESVDKVNGTLENKDSFAGKTENGTTSALERHFRIFQTFFMIGFMVHCRKYEDSYFIGCIAHLVAFVLLPCQEVVFGSFLLLVMRNFADFTPHCANHHNMVALVSLVLIPQQIGRALVSLGATQYRDGVRAMTKETLSCLHYLVLGIYIMAGFHKINRDFLYEPTVSCAFKKVEAYFRPLMGEDFQDHLPPVLGYSLPWGVLVLEFVPPILLLYPKWRRWGMLLLIKLHTILLPVGFADFGSIAQSFLWLFVSPELVSDCRLPLSFYNHMALVFVGFESTVYMERLRERSFDRNLFRDEEALLVFVVYGIMWFNIFRTKERKPIHVQTPRSKWSWLIFAFFVFFVMNPYLGLRTVGNLTMFSNLRTDGPTSNHLLLGSNPLKIFHLQEDTIEVIDADERFEGDNKPQIVPGYKVQRLVFDRQLVEELEVADEFPELYLKIHYEDQILETFDLNNDPAFDIFRRNQEPWWSRIYHNFRAVPVSREPFECKW